MNDAMSGTRKSAIVLMALGPEQADQILRQLPGDAIKRVTRELAMVRGTDGEARTEALSEFLRTAKPHAESVAPSRSESMERKGGPEGCVVFECITRSASHRHSEPHMDITTVLVIVVLILLLGGGGWYGRGRWYGR